MDPEWRRIASLHADEWMARFASELGRLGVAAEPRMLLEWGFLMWRTESGRSPEEVAREEFAGWPC